MPTSDVDMSINVLPNEEALLNIEFQRTLIAGVSSGIGAAALSGVGVYLLGQRSKKEAEEKIKALEDDAKKKSGQIERLQRRLRTLEAEEG
jgi:Tfp pilus assembly protein PilN